MRRDPDLIRLIMLKLEAFEKPSSALYYVSCRDDLSFDGFTYDQVYYHVDQILQKRWLDSAGDNTIDIDGSFGFRSLTPQGHDFVDSVRDDTIWKLTKEGAIAAGGFTLDTLSALGKGFLRKQMERLTGIPLG